MLVQNMELKKINNNIDNHNRYIINKFINTINQNGNKNLASKIFINSLNILQSFLSSQTHQSKSTIDSLTFFITAIERVKPIIHFKRITRKKIRPYPLSKKQQYGFACRWLVHAARKQKQPNLSFYHLLAIEIFKAYHKQGVFNKKIQLYKYIDTR